VPITAYGKGLQPYDHTDRQSEAKLVPLSTILKYGADKVLPKGNGYPTIGFSQQAARVCY
jgi:hypothetical protein